MKPLAILAPTRLVLIALALSSSACVSKLAESRVRSALVSAGIDRANAACMAERMTDRLSIGQLRRLEALQAPKRSLADYVWTVKRLDDPQLVQVTTSAAALCALGLAPKSGEPCAGARRIARCARWTCGHALPKAGEPERD
jgi:hypothetical protein